MSKRLWTEYSWSFRWEKKTVRNSKISELDNSFWNNSFTADYWPYHYLSRNETYKETLNRIKNIIFLESQEIVNIRSLVKISTQISCGVQSMLWIKYIVGRFIKVKLRWKRKLWQPWQSKQSITFRVFAAKVFTTIITSKKRFIKTQKITEK